MTPHAFIQKWKPVTLTERASAQEHFIDLCRLLDHPTPAEDDPTGERFAFEKGVTKTGRRRGLRRCLETGLFTDPGMIMMIVEQMILDALREEGRRQAEIENFCGAQRKPALIRSRRGTRRGRMVGACGRGRDLAFQIGAIFDVLHALQR